MRLAQMGAVRSGTGSMSRYIVLIPAAGVGQRFGAACPKQYVQLAGQTVLQHTVNRLLQLDNIDFLLIVVSPQDTYIDDIYPATNLPKRVHILHCGGSTRAETVGKGMAEARQRFNLMDDDWLLVHDAARCCVTIQSVLRLMQAVQPDDVGGLLAMPVTDTLKLADIQGYVCKTVDRSRMWQAQTPQMFRFGLLARALAQADLSVVTDEASAIEALGLNPLLVLGDICNLKITTPQDLVLARFFLHQE